MGGRLEDHIAVVTGGALGLGKGICERLAEEGAHVVLADIDPQVKATWFELKERFPSNRGFAATVDVTSAQAVDQLVEEVSGRFDRLDLMVNNAGIGQKVVSLADTPDEIFDRVIGVNLRGVFNGCRAAARLMRNQGSGSIVNIGSWYGKLGHANVAVYCASKAGVIRMTECLALEMAPYGVRVNSICPGNMDTRLHWIPLKEEAELRGISFEQADREMKKSIPLGRQGLPKEIGDAVVFLASDEASYITGTALNVNGGVLFS